MSNKPTKVFCIGFMKTGTTTLNNALTQLGYKVSHNSWRWLSHAMHGEFDVIKKKMMEWDAVEDNPIPLIYKELDAAFPQSKFILTVRNSDKWYESVRYHIGNLRSPMHEWIFGKGKSIPDKDKTHTINVFEGHIASVKKHFKNRPNDLLIMDMSRDADWALLCNFLNEPVPDIAFPHANKTSYERSKLKGFKSNLKYRKKQIINPIKIKWLKCQNLIPDPIERLKGFE